MKRILWLDEEKKEIIQMYNNGCKQIEIAEYFNVSQTAISTRLRKWKVSNPDGNRFIRVDIPKNVLYDLYWNKELHPVEIGKKFGCGIAPIHRKMKQYGIPTRTKSEARMGKLNPIYGVGHTEEARKKMSEAFTNGRKIGFNSHWGKGSYYDTPHQGRKWMRSGWEVKVADYLTRNNINWYYEYKWLKVKYGVNYLPDFYLPDKEKYIEVKGRKKKKDLEKIILAQQKYNIELWDGEELLKRGIVNNSGVAEINRKYR
ncbi:hypothetical protein LCGC14_0470190 [marine sediment metagenome]|uniref:Nuclease associated modular domain-containing protein n=1 Tax=marine sediment metagenome TaxID=412755 RepID=A0A0F9SCF5_9ZZZZ